MIRKAAQISALVLIFTIPWETAITISSLGTLTRLIGFGAAGIWALSVLIAGKLRKIHPFHFAVLLFMLFNVASLFWTVSLDLTFTRIKTYLQLAILIWMFWDLFTESGSLRMAMQIFIFGNYLAIASQLANYATGQIISAYEQGRFTGAGQNAGELALILSISLPIAWHLALTQKSGQGAIFLKVINFAFIPLALLSTILTASRTSLITNIPGLLYMVFTMRNIKPMYRGLIFIAIILTFLILEPFIPQATLERLSTIGASIAGSDLGGRILLWRGSFGIFLEHPTLGIGSNALSAPGQLGAFAHNTFLSVMAELGLPGLLLFLTVLFFVVYEAIRQPKPYSSLWVTVITIWFIGINTLTWEYTKTTWFILNLVIISAGIYCQSQIPEENPSPAFGGLADMNLRLPDIVKHDHPTS